MVSEMQSKTLQNAKWHESAAISWGREAPLTWEATGQEAEVRRCWDWMSFHGECADALFYQVELSQHIADYLRARGNSPTI